MAAALALGGTVGVDGVVGGACGNRLGQIWLGARVVMRGDIAARG
ncbi:hypothetical protein ACI3KY_00840 [Microbacterium sp. ZW T2_14]